MFVMPEANYIYNGQKTRIKTGKGGNATFTRGAFGRNPFAGNATLSRR